MIELVLQLCVIVHPLFTLLPPSLLSNPSCSSSSVSSANSSASFFSPTRYPRLINSDPSNPCSFQPATQSATTQLHTPLSLPMHALPPSRHSPVYPPQAGPSSTLAHSSHSFNPPPSAPPLLPSPTFAHSPHHKRVFDHHTLSDFCTARPSPLPSSSSVRPPPMSKVAEFSAQMICYLWFAEPSSLPRSAPDPGTSGSQSLPINTAQLVPNPEFILFIHNVLNTTQLSHSVVLLALFYIHRLKSLNPIKPNAKSEYRIGVVSLMLANKMLDDHTYTAKTWADVSRLPLASLNDGEIEFLQGLDFKLHVTVRDFTAWFRLLRGIVHLKDHHTANALASGPRTRWFKKMRVISAEGLEVLEGLVAPIRNSSMIREEEEAHIQLYPPTPPRPAAPDSIPRSRPTCEESIAHPSHSYNLRRSARNVAQLLSSSNRPMHSLRQPTISPLADSSSPAQARYAPSSWGPSPLVPAHYSRPVLPLLNLTPVQADTCQSQLPRQSSYQAYPTSTRSAAPHPSTAGHKRNLSDPIEELTSATQTRKRVASMAHASLGPIPCSASRKPPALSQSRLPPIALPNSSPPKLPGLTYYLHPQSNAHLNYLAHPIVPAQPSSIPDLYFHSLGAGGPAQLVRQEVNCHGSQVYVFGSQPWRQGTPMASSTQSSPRYHQFATPPPSSAFYHSEISPYSHFSNAGMPSVTSTQATMPSHHLHPHQQRVLGRVRSADAQPWTTTGSFKYGLLGRS